jgi:hypothetical protein
VTAASSFQSVLRLWLRVSAADRFDAATWNPGEAQERKLLEILRRNAPTIYGREHGFADVASIRDFQRRVPVSTYETLEPYVERTLRGEQGILTADSPVMFATTSGTTGRSKFIPVTPSYLAEYSHGVHVHNYRILADFRDILDGKLFVSSSNDIEGHAECGLPYGAISGYLARTQPRSIRRFYALPYALARVKHVDSKYYLSLLHALLADIRLLVAPNPSSLLLLAEKMAMFADDLIRDIRTGSVNEEFTQGVPAVLRARREPNPRRAAELTSLQRQSGRLFPAEVWPNLRLLSCWKGGNMPLYLRKIPGVYGDLPIRDLGYMASEGRGATPLVNSGAGGVLNVTSHVFEFVQEHEREQPGRKFLTCEDLEPNGQYYIYFTTSAGLYRYDINDVVRVVDFYRNTPVIQFVRKGQGISSITGEKLTESQVTDALVELVERDDLGIGHFTAAVQWGEPPCYAFYVEADDSMTRERCQRFAHEMDRALCTRNSEYEAKRDSQRLGPPVLKKVAPGTYEELRRRRVAAGAPEAQVKLPQLSTDIAFGENIIVLEEVPLGQGAAG